MVIANLDVKRTVVLLRPLNAHTPLLIDSNAELAFAIPAQSLKPIAGQEHKVASADRRLQNIQTPLRLLPEGLKHLHSLACGKSLRPLVSILRRRI